MQIIEGLEKNEFDDLIKFFLKSSFNLQKIIITDGKDDVGLDIRVFSDKKSRKIQFQLTTQKSKTVAEKNAFNKKVLEDFAKAKINAESYHYEKKLVYFYSYSLTQKSIREFEKLAYNEFDISLDFYDANRLTQEIEDYPEIQEFILSLIGINKQEEQFDSNLLYDLISFGKPTEFKNQIIEAFIYQLFLNKDSLTFEEIKEEVETRFKLVDSTDYFKKQLNILLTNKVISKNKETGNFHITDDAKKQLSKKRNDFLLEQALFKNYVRNILEKYNQEYLVDEYVFKLTEIYTNNFDKNLDDISSNSESYQLSHIYNDFSTYIKERLNTEEVRHKELAIELLQLCQRNNFVQKISASNVYLSKINDKKIEKYLTTSKKIFIDTSIGLFAICYYFKPETNYDNFYFKTTKRFIHLLKNEKLNAYISERYVWEIANHFKEAFRLIPFSQIIKGHNFGNSRNVFYNFFLYLKKNENYLNSFEDFMKTFGIREEANKDSYNSNIESFLENLNIQKEVIQKEYEIVELNGLLNDYLKKTYKNKTNFAKNCDSIMFAFLADNDIEVHKLEPIFLTWDKSFYEIQKDYIKYYPKSQKWINTTPNKYIDSNSLLKFSIDNETFTENLLAFVSDEIIINTHSLIDSLAVILNVKDEVGLEFANKLAKLREEEINKLANAEIIIPENYDGESILDDVVFNITEHYKSTENFTNFKSLFTKKELVEDILELIDNSVKNYYEQKQIDDEIYAKFDKLIKNII